MAISSERSQRAPRPRLPRRAGQWDLVIAQDFFNQFDRANPLKGVSPQRYRQLVLQPGGSMSANDLVKNFLGRPQNMTALQGWMDEEFKGSGSGSQAGAQSERK